MTESLSREFYRKLAAQMLDKNFLKEAGVRKKEMKELLMDVEWNRFFDEAFAKEASVSCEKTAQLLSKPLKKLGKTDAGELLRYVYDWTRAAMFPENFHVDADPARERARLFYCGLLHILLEMERTYKGFVPTRHFALLPAQPSPDGDPKIEREYRTFLLLMRGQYMEEFYRIAAEITPFDTLGHVAGVHEVAMRMARQLKALGKPVDLKLLSGAAALHDIGKFGCRESELKRIPYLHYYYSDDYTRRFRMPTIGHIAVNHSTWDLELDDLSVENLLLIYADFRVKSTRGADGKEIVHFYTLKESFDVILGKLDHVDAKKEARYRLVYAKLKDFEDYMEALGVDTDPSGDGPRPVEETDPVLLDAGESLRRLKHLAIEHNILVMTRLNSESGLQKILEAARSERSWRMLRAYVGIFNEYFTYLDEKQTHLTLEFLFELLFHAQIDIRRQASYLCGRMIAGYDQEYRKELPKDVQLHGNSLPAKEIFGKMIDAALHPDDTLTEQHRIWLGRCLKRIVRAVLTECHEKDRAAFLDVFLGFLGGRDYMDAQLRILLNAAKSIPSELLLDEAPAGEERAPGASGRSADRLELLLSFVRRCNAWDDAYDRLMLLRFLRHLADASLPRECLLETAREVLSRTKEDTPLLLYMKYRLCLSLGLPVADREGLEARLFDNDALQSQIFLEDLKVATRGMIKLGNVELLGDVVRRGDPGRVSRIAGHLTNLFSASRRLSVREYTGEQLVRMMPLLSSDQRNEIVIEMAESLGSGEFEYVRYVPLYLGKIALYLYPEEMDELLDDTFTKYINSSDTTAVMYTIHTIGVMLSHYPEYRRYGEAEDVYVQRRRKLTGLLMKGLFHYDADVQAEALTVIGRDVLASDVLTLRDRGVFLSEIVKKLFDAVSELTGAASARFSRSDAPDSARPYAKDAAFGGAGNAQGVFRLLERAVALGMIYRFIAEYEFSYGALPQRTVGKIAFFPGTFDPFSNGHKEIVRMTRDLGFEVYLAVDEFSWSKKTQPKLIRRKLIRMSVADLANVYLFPDPIPVNIANPDDMKKLSELFPGKMVYLTAGADVIANASAYRGSPSPHSVHGFPHILFCRGNDWDRFKDVVRERISGETIYLKLDPKYDEVSSSRIRDNIDRNRDISNLIDPLAQRYIRDHGLYRREPKFKQAVDGRGIRLCRSDALTKEQARRLFAAAKNDAVIFCGDARRIREGDIGVWLTDASGGVIGAMCMREVPLAGLFDEFGDVRTADRIRTRVSGRLAAIYTLYLYAAEDADRHLELLLTEAFADSLKKGFTHLAAHFSDGRKKTGGDVAGCFAAHGFQRLSDVPDGREIFLVDMSFPLLVIQNLETVVKEPFTTNGNVRRTLAATRRRFMGAMTKLYPGSLVIAFDSTYMSRRMLERITAENGVSGDADAGTAVGPKMCIPYGRMFRDALVPNTVTKAIYTEKVYTPDASDSWIGEYPNHSPLKTQIRTIASFGRPAILADDILHKGDRLKKLYPMLKEGGVPVDRLVVGVLSGHGADLAALYGIAADSVYFIPNLRAWFPETNMYPFLGGDCIETPDAPRGGLLPALNQILPYTVPQFLENITWNDYFDFSMACLQNAYDILRTLEEEYETLYRRGLTLERLGEALRDTYCADPGNCMAYDLQVPASTYVRNDMLRMERLKNMVD